MLLREQEDPRSESWSPKGKGKARWMSYNLPDRTRKGDIQAERLLTRIW